MSVVFPTDKDNIIDELDDTYELELTDQEYDRLRVMTIGELYLVTGLFARAARNAKFSPKP